MEGVGDLIVESKIVNELKGELGKAYKTIAEREAELQKVLKEKDAEVQTLLEKNAVLKKRLQINADDREPEAKPSPILERKAEEIIPKECWGVVFQNLDGEDMLSCRKVCRTFNQVLDAKEFKVQWKFKLILPVLLPYLKTTYPDRNPSWEHLHNARLVCRSWLHWIDKYASEVYGTTFFPLPAASELPLVTLFPTFEDIENFQERFGECKTNPFPSRSVCISNLEDEDDEDYTQDTHNAYIEKAGYLLVQFGKHIIRLRLFLYDNTQNLGPDPLTLCKLIRRITIHLPNLKELFIRDGWSNEEDEDEVASYIADNALAELPKLQALSMFRVNKKAGDYLLDAFGPQLTQLETPLSNGPCQLQMQKLKNVRKLWLELKEPSDTLETLRFLESPLEILKLSCRFESALETWNVDTLLRNLKHLPLEILKIHLRIWDRGGRASIAEAGIDREEYNNASIKTLIIHIDQDYDNGSQSQISFNFLQALTKLENLELKFSGEQHPTTHPIELPEEVKVNEYLFGEDGTELPYHSNVWEKVSSIKTLALARRNTENEFTKSIYTREKYEKIIAGGDWPERN